MATFVCRDTAEMSLCSLSTGQHPHRALGRNLLPGRAGTPTVLRARPRTMVSLGWAETNSVARGRGVPAQGADGAQRKHLMSGHGVPSLALEWGSEQGGPDGVTGQGSVCNPARGLGLRGACPLPARVDADSGHREWGHGGDAPVPGPGSADIPPPPEL